MAGDTLLWCRDQARARACAQWLADRGYPVETESAPAGNPTDFYVLTSRAGAVAWRAEMEREGADHRGEAIG